MHKGMGTPAFIAIIAVIVVAFGAVYVAMMPEGEKMMGKGHDMAEEGDKMMQDGQAMKDAGDKMMQDGETMMRGDTLAVVVANRHHEELSELAGSRDIFFATRPHAAGILEAIEHYDFFGACRVPVP